MPIFKRDIVDIHITSTYEYFYGFYGELGKVI
jgi:hypothetical protein